jgi:hypothetical protein
VRPLAPLLLAGALAACDAADASPPGPTPCGEGPATLALGVGHPYAPLPEPPRVALQRGTQGGFHVLVSLWVVGAFDGDHGNLELALYDGDRRISELRNDDALFGLDPMRAGCFYDQARLVMLDAEGGLMREDDVLALGGREVELAVRLTSGLGDAEGRFRFSLDALQ